MREHPARDVAVEPAPLPRIIEQALVCEDPFVGRRTHRHRADLGEESAEPVVRDTVRSGLEQPLERVVRIRDESIDARRRVVLRLRHPEGRRAVFSWSRTRTIFRTSAAGIGSSAWNRSVPFPEKYGSSSSPSASMTAALAG